MPDYGEAPNCPRCGGPTAWVGSNDWLTYRCEPCTNNNQREIRVGDIVQIRGKGDAEWKVTDLEPNLTKLYRSYDNDKGMPVVVSARIEGASARGALWFVREGSRASLPTLDPSGITVRSLMPDEWAESRDAALFEEGDD